MKNSEIKLIIETTFLRKDNSINGRKLKKEFINETEISKNILINTLFCPHNCPETLRAKFILNNITEFPKCKNCGNNTKWSTQAPKTLDYCSIKCASSHDLTRKKVRTTNLERFGVEQIMKSEKFKNNYKNTCLNKYGVDNVSKVNSVKEKKIETNLKNWGVENVSQSEIIHLSKQNTCFKNNGTNFPAQNKLIFKKQESSCGNVKKFNETLTSQGSYELYFLTLMNEAGFIEEVHKGESFEYILLSKKHMYHADFYFRGVNIEIKSTWFYNKNGKDINLQNKNETKWSAVRDNVGKLIVLMSKKEIKDFVDSL